MVLEDSSKIKSNKEQQAAMRKLVDWHRAEALKYQGSTDPEEKQAYKVHKDVAFEYVRIGQEYFYGNNSIAERMLGEIPKEIEKSKLVMADVAARKK